MLAAVADRMRNPMPQEHAWRFRLVIVLVVIFAGVTIAKSLMWRASVHRLEQTLRQTQSSCLEIGPAGFQWLENYPYSIVNNWSLPTLALVVQDQRPRKLLLEQNGCRLAAQSGKVQIDPWNLIEKKYLIPPVD
jgi:hypothetical protein